MYSNKGQWGQCGFYALGGLGCGSQGLKFGVV